MNFPLTSGGFRADGLDFFPDGANTTNGNYVLELRNPSNVLVDAVADETFRGTERANLTAEQVAQTAGGWWGQDPSFNLASSNNSQFSNGRFRNGVDTNNNGYDFGMLPVTPGLRIISQSLQSTRSRMWTRQALKMRSRNTTHHS